MWLVFQTGKGEKFVLEFLETDSLDYIVSVLEKDYNTPVECMIVDKTDILNSKERIGSIPCIHDMSEIIISSHYTSQSQSGNQGKTIDSGFNVSSKSSTSTLHLEHPVPVHLIRMTQNDSTSKSNSAKEVNVQEYIEQLMKIGFSREEATQALAISNNDYGSALQALLSGEI